ATIRANVSSTPDFLEDFEAEGEYATYSNQTFYGTSAIWNFTNVGIWPSSDPTHSGKAAARFGKDSGSSIEMAEDRHKGVSTVSFFARTFNNDGSATLDVDYSTDGGRTYTTAGTVTVDKSDYTEYKVFVGITGDVRIRLQQTTGKRLLIDDVALTPQATGLDDPGAERHAWNAYSLDGSIIVEVSRQSEIAVYCIDGTTVFAGVLDEGTHSFEGRPGTLYIVAGSDFARRVLVK
ncbi:MAG: hypothetical protein K2F63_00160, partial [Muribaculaceae bacterium]|nr:hypothetical protein [Muribaculaceae bacterium]